MRNIILKKNYGSADMAMDMFRIGWRLKSGGPRHEGTTEFDYAHVCIAVNIFNALHPEINHFRVPGYKVSLKTTATAKL